MSATDSVTTWLERFKSGDRDEASRRLWDGYFDKLVRLAYRHLSSATGRAEDAEDVALSAFASFVRAADAGRLPALEDRNNLWAVLLTITSRKAAKLMKSRGTQKRGGHNVRCFSAFENHGADSEAHADVDVPTSEPGPCEAVAVAEECGRLLDLLDDGLLRQVAVAKLEGYTNREIGEQVQLREKTIERKLRLIRQTWEENGVGPEDPVPPNK
jgi:DNA-directed RNA polymerase specialized sigma24 family protein